MPQKELADLFAAANKEIFEDGMESKFSQELLRLVQLYGNLALETLVNLIIGEMVSSETAAEALRWLGDMDHPSTHQSRLWLAEQCLFCSSALIRDGAILALASLDDPMAISNLKLAIAFEQIPELRKDMEQVLAQLKATTS